MHHAIELSILIGTALWHATAAWHFGLYPARTVARTTAERPVNVLTVELFRFLAGLNVALVVLALAAVLLDPAQRWPVYLSLCVANASQFLADRRMMRLQLVHGPMFTQILWGDAFFTLVNAFALVR